MPLIDTGTLTPSSMLSQSENDQVYCALDCCLTLEVFEEISRIYGSDGVAQDWRGIYDFERALQGPYFDIMTRGMLVDRELAREAGGDLRERIGVLRESLDALASSVWDKRFREKKNGNWEVHSLNPNSPLQLKEFLYGALKLPEQWLRQKGERKLSVGREALEKLDEYLYARPFCNIILAIRDLAKQAEVFETDIDSDSRFRASYNIAGTETGRPSSSENAFGTGRNAQNIASGLRYVFVADPGKVMCVVDLEQVEARDTGYFMGCLFDDWKFLDNCESGDLHTNNCRFIWPQMPWTKNKKKDREIADQNFYREFSYRDMSKRGGHLTGYYGTAWTMARSLKIPLPLAEEFQARYCKGGVIKNEVIHPAFTGFTRWWQWTAQQLQTTHQLITPFGRRRHFFGRPGDDTTLREAIAFLPQSTTADRMNLGLWRVWRHERRVELLAQTYDSITFQFDQREDADEIISNVLELIKIELRSPHGRSYVVPGECKWGFNWGSRVTEDDRSRATREGRKAPRLNLDGLRKWKRGERLGVRSRNLLSGFKMLVDA